MSCPAFATPACSLSYEIHISARIQQVQQILSSLPAAVQVSGLLQIDSRHSTWLSPSADRHRRAQAFPAKRLQASETQQKLNKKSNCPAVRCLVGLQAFECDVSQLPEGAEGGDVRICRAALAADSRCGSSRVWCRQDTSSAQPTCSCENTLDSGTL